MPSERHRPGVCAALPSLIAAADLQSAECWQIYTYKSLMDDSIGAPQSMRSITPPPAAKLLSVEGHVCKAGVPMGAPGCALLAADASLCLSNQDVLAHLHCRCGLLRLAKKWLVPLECLLKIQAEACYNMPTVRQARMAFVQSTPKGIQEQSTMSGL